LISAGFAEALPKAELHIHIEGSLEPEMVFALAERNDVPLEDASVDDLRRRYAFSDLSSFLQLYYAGMAVLRTREDFAELSEAYLRRAVAEGVRHVEMFFDPQAHTVRGVTLDPVLDGLLDGFAAVSADHDLSGGLIMCFLRDRPVADAMATLRSAEHRFGDLLGVGLDSAEVGYPPSLFAEVFAAARSAGLRLVAHAGEEGPPDYVREALDVLGVERIDHGIRASEDPALLDRLAADRIPLTVCPLSNLRLGVVDDLSRHPLPSLLERGVLATLNSDDPAYFGGYVADNYLAVAEHLGLGADELAHLARNSISASFASAERKAELLGA
jgi:adenosine deaminase